MQEMAIKDILDTVKKRLWVILIFCVIVTAMVGVYYLKQPNEFTAQTTLYVLFDYEDNLGQTRYDTTASAQFAGDFKELMKTNSIMSQTLARLGIDKEAFKGVSIDVAAVTGTRVLNVTATSLEPLLSMNVANTVSQVFTEYIRNVMRADTVTIAAEATLPEIPSGPPRTRNTLLAFGVSLMFALGIALAIEMLNTTLRNSGEVEKELELPVLASMQSFKKELDRVNQKQPKRKTLLQSIPAATKENAKTLATNVQFATVGHPVQTLLFTSSIAGEGKSSLLLLLADALADLGKRVLIVDMDMRNPSIGRYLGVRCRNDLFDYLVDAARLDKVICKTENPRVFFIDSHHRLASVSQIVNYEVFEMFLDTVKKDYDMILFDTPPLGLFIDAAVLANSMDAALLVVGSGMADRTHARSVVEQLRKANANILGVAFNFAAQHKSQKYYYGNSYGYYSQSKVQS